MNPPMKGLAWHARFGASQDTRPSPLAVSAGLADYAEVDKLGVWYKSVNFGVWWQGASSTT